MRMARKVRTICIVILCGVILAALTLDATARRKPGSLPVRLTSKDQARRLAEGLQSKYPEKYLSPRGVAGANAVENDGRVWVTAVGDGLDPHDYAIAGFDTATLRITGSSWTGVTVTATADIRNVQSHGRDSGISFNVEVFGGGRVTYKRTLIYRPGTYNVTTDPFTMAPGKDYYARATIRCDAGKENAISTVTDTQITSIKWNF